MVNFEQYLIKNIYGGRISEIYDISENYFNQSPQDLAPETKLHILCSIMKITPSDLDEIISSHSAVSRTIKGHAFEVVFDAMMHLNKIECIEVGGDTNVDRQINNHTLQLKTPFVNGCSDGIVSYKTHKTHGAKSETESMNYYHQVNDFADFLVGLVSYEPFHVLIVPKSELPRTKNSVNHIESPMFLKNDNPSWLNNFHQFGISIPLDFPTELLLPQSNECLPLSSNLLQLRSDYILRAIFIKDNFRIWDMNMRGFIREHVFTMKLLKNGIKSYPVTITGLARSNKCDIVLKKKDNRYVCFQVKGLTWNGCTLNKENTTIDCETQLSRGRVNDHPTQSRLYMDTDFEYLIIAIDPPYANTLSLETFGTANYSWNFYCIPMSQLRKHPKYTHRVSSHQYIKYQELQQYRIHDDWFSIWKKEL